MNEFENLMFGHQERVRIATDQVRVKAADLVKKVPGYKSYRGSLLMDTLWNLGFTDEQVCQVAELAALVCPRCHDRFKDCMCGEKQ